MKDEINLRSYGKINLCLDVLRRRGTAITRCG